MSAILVALQLAVSAPAPAPAPAEAPAPPGFLRFCIEFPEECGSQDVGGYDRLLSRPVLAPYWEGVFSKPSASLRPPPAFFGRRAAARSARRVEQEASVSASGSSESASLRDLRAFEAVNREVNWRVRPQSDQQAFGASDYWTLPLSSGERGVGDCEDFALQKRSMLRKAGYPMSMMSVALVDALDQQTHAVLLLNTDKGVLVLDNLDSRVRRLSKTRYRIISREDFGAPLRWLAGPIADTGPL